MRTKKSGLIERVTITLITTAGIVVLLYPTIANWFSSLGFEEQRGSYEEAAQELTDEERDRIIDGAREYNESLPSGPLRDPYMLADDGDVIDQRDDTSDYEAQLDFGEGLMGWVQIPSTNTALPIYHGTEDETLDKGAGHLYGSALPVGGDSSHSVVTAHSGRAEAALFTDLEKLEIGDIFYTEVAGEQFYYKVDEIEIVEPVYSGEKLRQVPGKDYVTLLTCTPTGVNSHRLLVRGERMEGPEAAEAAKEIRATDYVPDFPWWIPVVIGTPIATWALLTLVDKTRARGKRARSSRPAHSSAPVPEAAAIDTHPSTPEPEAVVDTHHDELSIPTAPLSRREARTRTLERGRK